MKMMERDSHSQNTTTTPPILVRQIIKDIQAHIFLSYNQDVSVGALSLAIISNIFQSIQSHLLYIDIH